MKWAKLKCSGKGRLELGFSEIKNVKKKSLEHSFRIGRKSLRIELDHWPLQGNIRNKKTPIGKKKETKQFPGMVSKEALWSKDELASFFVSMLEINGTKSVLCSAEVHYIITK